MERLIKITGLMVIAFFLGGWYGLWLRREPSPNLKLVERDGESWEGHKFGEHFVLDGQLQLHMQVGVTQRFNPQLWNGTQTTAGPALVEIDFPLAAFGAVVTPKEWWTGPMMMPDADHSLVRGSWWLMFPDIPPGMIAAPVGSAWFLTPLARGQFEIHARIATMTAAPVNQEFSVVVD